MSARLQPASILLYLHVGLRFATLSRGSPCGGRANPASELLEQLEQTPSKFHACTPAVCHQSSRACLASSRSPYLHVCTPAARLQSSRPPYLHVCTPAARL